MALRRADAERAIQDFLVALGHDPRAVPELSGTPARVVDAFANELLSGYAVDIPALLEDGSEPAPGGEAGIVVVDGIQVSTVCPHHLMPAVGSATVAYAPGSRILGLGTVARLAQAFAKRLSLQENIGKEVVDTLVGYGARGAFCRLELRHSCLSARGAEQQHASVHTTASAGSFTEDDGRRQLVLALGREPRAT